MDMKKLLFLFLAVTLLTACDEKATDDSLSVSKDLLEFGPEGGTQEFQIFSNSSWKIIVADDNPYVNLSASSGFGNATIAVTLSLPGGRTSDTTTRLIVRTDDGSSLKNVNLLEHGYFGKDVALEITNWANLLPMNGKAYSEDSLTIHTNVPWQLRGPEWIEAYDGKEWVKLSMERAVISGSSTMKAFTGQNDTYNLKIRCATENDDEEDRVGTLILESTYTKDKGQEIEIYQLGRLRVTASQVLPLAHAIAWEWKYGKDVATIKYQVETESYGNYITESVMKTWPTAKPDNAYGKAGLKANTAYFIYAYGLDSAGAGLTDSWRAVGIYTNTDVNQPLTDITAIQYQPYGDIDIIFHQNEFSQGFCIFYLPSSRPEASYNDGLMAWLFYQYMHDGNSSAGTMYSFRTWTLPFSFNEHMHFVTWSKAPDTNVLSGLIVRYDTAKEWASNAPSYVADDKPQYDSFPLDKLEEFKKSIILIK